MGVDGKRLHWLSQLQTPPRCPRRVQRQVHVLADRPPRRLLRHPRHPHPPHLPQLLHPRHPLAVLRPPPRPGCPKVTSQPLAPLLLSFLCRCCCCCCSCLSSRRDLLLFLLLLLFVLLQPTQKPCHPERSNSRTLRVTKSKDLRLPLFLLLLVLRRHSERSEESPHFVFALALVVAFETGPVIKRQQNDLDTPS